MSDGKWKDLLLKSSLPLEHVVASELSALNWIVWGQYPYSRNNESGLSVEFSADLQATKEYSSKTHGVATLDILLECKYASPGVKWIFLPYPETAQLFSGVVKVFDGASNKRVTDRKYLEQFESAVEYCVRGVALHDSGCDENAITRGSSQLRYAMPRLAESTFASHANDWHDEDIAVTFACAVLVTTAPLYCLKPGLVLEDIYAAKSLDELLDPKEAVVLWDSDSPDRSRYCRDVYRKIPSNDVEKRISQYASVFSPTTKIKYPPSKSDAQRAINQSGDHVLVTSLQNLGTILKSLEAAVAPTTKNIQKIAEVSFDHENREAIISPLKSMLRKQKKQKGAASQ